MSGIRDPVFRVYRRFSTTLLKGYCVPTKVPASSICAFRKIPGQDVTGVVLF